MSQIAVLNNNTVVSGTKSKDTIIVRANNVSIDALAGNDLIQIDSGTSITVLANAGNDSLTIDNSNVSNVIVDGGAGNDKIFLERGSNVTVNTGDGNDLVQITSLMGGAVINANSGKDTITVWNPSVAPTIIAGGNTTVQLSKDNSSVVTSAISGGNVMINIVNDAQNVKATLIGNANGSYTLSGTSGQDVISISSGDAVISNYEQNDVIYLSGTVTETLNSKTDVFLKTSNGSVRIKNGAGHQININGTKKVLGNSYSVTQKQVIQKFMSALDKTTKKGTEAVNEALVAATGISTLTANILINQIVADAKSSNFLEDYCGIILNNSDTGAITGSDAGGSSIKTASSVIPETAVHEQLPVGNGVTETIKGLVVQYPTIAAAKSTYEQQIIDGLHSWWISDGIDIITESYGNNFGFDTSTSVSSATVNKMDVNFESKPNSGTLAYVSSESTNGVTNKLSLTVNDAYYTSLESVINNKDGESTVSGSLYLDRTIAHELTHAAMAANIQNFGDLPHFIKEGMAELTHGIDDERRSDLIRLASKPATLKKALNLTGNKVADDNYAGGYIFFKYLAHQYSSIVSSVGDTQVTGLTYSNDATSLTVDGNYSANTLSSYSKIVNSINATSRKATQPIYIVGNNISQSIVGGKGNDTISAGIGTNTLTGGAGNDVFLYSDDDMIITDYQTGKDVIQFDSDVTFSSASVDTVSKNVLINTNKGTITLNKVAKVSNKGVITGNKVKLVDGYGNSISRIFGATSISIADSDADTFNLNSNLVKDLTSVNASARKTPVYLIANSLGNTLNGGKAADTISSGSGNDYIKGANGDDVFIYSGGNDTIADYTAATNKTTGDKIQLATGLSTANVLANYQVIGNDVILPFATGDSLTVVKGKDKRIVFTDSNDIIIPAMSFIYNDPAVKVIDSTYDTLYSFTNDSLLSSESSARIRTIDASKRTAKAPIYITAESNNTMSLIGGKGNDTLDGGSHNNVLTGGKGKDVFIYSGGKDTISDYTAGQDSIYLDSDVALADVSIAPNGTDIVFEFSVHKNNTTTTSWDNSLLIQNAIKKGTAQKITFNVQGDVTSQVYGQARFAVVNGDGEAGATINAGTAANEGVVKSIIASSRGKKFPIYLVGNNLNNSLVGGAGDDTLNGVSATSSGKNTLTGGKGNDLFIYSGGYDIITDYSNANGNVDSIKVPYNEVSDYRIDNDKDVIITNSSAEDIIKIINGKDKYINLINTSSSDTSKSKIFGNSYEKVFANNAIDNSITSYTATNEISVINASQRKIAIELTNNSDTTKTSIIGGAGNDTLKAVANSSELTLTGGKGKDVFVYNGGSVIISDYTAKQDSININRSDYLTYHVWGDDVHFNFGTGSVVSSVNELIVVGGAGKTISTTINGTASVGAYKDYESTVLSGSAPLTINATASTDTNKLVTFDGSKLKAVASAIITGNSKFGNVIKGGAGNDVLDGGDTGATKYDDILTGNKGNDIFIYRGGNDIITDYTAGQDKVSVSGLTYFGYSVDGKDILFSFNDSNSLKIKNGLDKNIEFASNTALTKIYNDPYKKVFTKTDNSNLFSDTTNMSLIDASKNSTAITIISNADTVKGSSKNDSIVGGNYIVAGAGNDTIQSINGIIETGKGKDVVVISKGNSNESIIVADYTAGQDVIHLENSVAVSSVNYAYNGDSETDLKFKFVNSNQTLIIKNAINIKNNTKITPQKITFEDSKGNQVKQTFMQTSLNVINTDGDVIDLSQSFNASVASVDSSKRSNKFPIFIKGNSLDNTLKGGAGADTIYAYSGTNFIEGGKGDDLITLGGGNNNIIYTTGNGNDTITSFDVSKDKIKLGSAKTKVNKVEYANGNLVFTIGKGSVTIKDVSTNTGIAVVDYSGNENIYTDNMVTAATTNTSVSASFMERDYQVNDTWFTSIDGSLVFDEIDNLVENKFDIAIKDDSLIQNEFDDEERVSKNIKLVQGRDYNSNELH